MLQWLPAILDIFFTHRHDGRAEFDSDQVLYQVVLVLHNRNQSSKPHQWVLGSTGTNAAISTTL